MKILVPSHPYQAIDSRPFHHSGLSLKAKGLFAMILLQPVEVKFDDLVSMCSDGKHAVRATLNELQKAGFVTRKTYRESGHFGGFTYQVTVSPFTDFLFPENQEMAAPFTENQEMVGASENQAFRAKKSRGAVKNFKNSDIHIYNTRDNKNNKEKDLLSKSKKESVKFCETEFVSEGGFDRFCELILKRNSDYQDADIRYYFERVRNWSDSTGARKKDWIATACNFILSDSRDGKLKKSNKNHGTKIDGVDAERIAARVARAMGAK